MNMLRGKDGSLNYDTFGKEVKLELEKLLGDEMRVELQHVTKNNGITLEGICILEPGSRVAPTIYLEEFYQEYQDGITVKEIASQVWKVYERSKKGLSASLDYFLDFQKVKDQILCKVISQKMNEKLLLEIPHIPYLDLAIAFFCVVESRELGSGSILIRNEHMRYWNVSRELLYEYARENTLRLRPFQLKSMEEIIEDLVEPQEQKLLKELPMYVLSNEDRIFGAAGILYDRVLCDAGEQLEEDFYVLPSSVHEVILVPDSVAGSPDYLRDMVHEVNTTQVEPEDVLSENIYHYDRKKHRLSV